MLGCAAAGLSLMLMSGPGARAGTFTTDFNSGIPAGMNVYGSIVTVPYNLTTGGVNNSGCLKLTTTTASQNSGMFLDDFDNGQTIAGFDATFQLYIGSGNGADGFSFYFGDFADNAATSEEGPGTIKGLTVCFDVYNNGGTPGEAPAIDVKWDNVIVFHRLVGAAASGTPASPLGSANTIRTQTSSGGAAVYWPVKIHVDTDGTLDIVYNNVVVLTNFPIFRAMTAPATLGPAYRFGMGARTGGSYDNHWVDNLTITTYPLDANSGQPFISNIQQVPVGANANTSAGVIVELQDGVAQDGVTKYSVNESTVVLKYNNTVVTPTISRNNNITRIAYAYFGSGVVLPSGLGTVNLAYETTSSPAFANNFTYTFYVNPYVTLGTNQALASVDTTMPGFKLRVHQMDDSVFIRAPGDRNYIVAGERELASGYIDPATGQPYPNVADNSLVGSDGFFTEPDYINFTLPGAAEFGNFTSSSIPSRPDKPFPGIPGMMGSQNNFAVEILTILQLKTGGNRFGINSDDGFRASISAGWDAAASIIGSFNGGRASADTMFDIAVPQDGLYPVRISYWQGTGDGNIEFFWFDYSTGTKVLVNDPDNLNAPRAYAASAAMRPSISRVLPVQNCPAAFPDDDVLIDIRNYGFQLNASTVALYINNVLQDVTISPLGSVTTVKRAGSVANLLPSGLNDVRLEYGYTDHGTPVMLTNSYSFTVAPYYGIIPPANKVPAGSVSGQGFIARAHQMDKSGDKNQGNGARINGGDDSNRMPWPEVEFAQGMINPTNGLPYPNLAKLSPDTNFVYAITDFINFNMNANAVVGDSGFFRSGDPNSPLLGAHADAGFPWLPGVGTSYSGLENFVAEIQTYLELKRGAYVFGFNSDDGFIAISAPNANDTLGTLLGFENRGKGNTSNLPSPTGANPPQVVPYSNQGDAFFSVIVLEDGIYPIRILYWQGGTGVNAEFMSLNRTNGTVLLINDTGTDPSAITAYSTYNGPARPWVKLSVSPNPWSGAYQMSGPGPIKMIGRTRGNANASDIYNVNNRDWARAWADVPIGGVIAEGASDPDLRLLVNGVEVPATKTTNGTDVVVSYQPNPPLPSYSTNTASLVYGGATNSWTFTVLSWTTLNESDAQPLSLAAPNSRGFRVKMTQVASIPAGYTQNTVARAEDQLAGIIGPNVAFPGPGPDGSYIYPAIINWNNNFQTNVSNPSKVPLGNFQPAGYYGAATGWPFPNYPDEPLPGVPGTGRSNTDNAAAEVFAYLAFPTAGYYRLGVNSDDGFGVKVGTPGVTNGTLILQFDAGKGCSDIPFSFVVPQPGLYPIRLVYYNGGGGAALEYFSYDANGNKIPINDPNNPNAIKAYFALGSGQAPIITESSIAGGSITIKWSNGGTLEWADAVNATTWTSTGNSSGTFTETVGTGTRFYRVKQ